jgi:hypothetical protein
VIDEVKFGVDEGGIYIISIANDVIGNGIFSTQHWKGICHSALGL